MATRISSFEQLAAHNRAGTILKYYREKDGRWKYVKMLGQEPERYRGGTYGYPANGEVTPAGVHVFHPLTDRDFKEGTIISTTTAREVRGKKWSYE